MLFEVLEFPGSAVVAFFTVLFESIRLMGVAVEVYIRFGVETVSTDSHIVNCTILEGSKGCEGILGES